MTVSVIIVSWNVRPLLKKCLTSIERFLVDQQHEIFVVDNDSSDHSAEMVKFEFPDVKLIANNHNKGFATACNQAISQSTGNYILLLNPDTELVDNSIGKVIAKMEEKEDCGIAGCKIKNPDGSIQPSVRNFPDLLSHIIILLKLHNFNNRIRHLNNYYRTDFDYSKSCIVDQVMGAFFMIKRDLINKIGFLDESFYIWYEEVDYCRRAKNKNYNTYYFHEANILHQKGQSFAQLKPLKKQYIFNRSMLHYFLKHSNIISYFILLILFPISLLLTLIIQIFGVKKKRKDL